MSGHVLRLLLVALVWSPTNGFADLLTSFSTIQITKSWSQQPNGYTYPISISVPVGPVPQGGFPVCILLHGNGSANLGSLAGPPMLSQAQFGSTLSSHILVAPTGYQNSWNIAAENSEAPDVQMIGDLVPMLQGYGNVNPNHIRVLGVSNGGSLANRIFAENRNPGIDIVSSVVSQLNTFQYRSGQFFEPSGVTDPSRPDGGYDVAILPLMTRKYLSVANVNDPIIPYEGGASRVGLTLLAAETAAFNIAQLKGYNGSLLTAGNEIGSGVNAITEFEYLSGEVVHLRGNAGHQLNSTQKSYITEFFAVPVAVPEPSAVAMVFAAVAWSIARRRR